MNIMCEKIIENLTKIFNENETFEPRALTIELEDKTGSIIEITVDCYETWSGIQMKINGEKLTKEKLI